jgi:hypothetical protein
MEVMDVDIAEAGPSTSAVVTNLTEESTGSQTTTVKSDLNTPWLVYFQVRNFHSCFYSFF